jgi:hypothetical protein
MNHSAIVITFVSAQSDPIKRRALYYVFKWIQTTIMELAASVMEYCIQMGKLGLPLVQLNSSLFIKRKKIFSTISVRPRFAQGPTVVILPGTIYIFSFFCSSFKGT